VVSFRDGVSEQDKNALNSARHARLRKRLRGRSRIEKLEPAAGQDPATVAGNLRYIPGVEFAEPNYLVTRDETVPDDPRFAEQWALKNTGQSGGPRRLRHQCPGCVGDDYRRGHDGGRRH
jgi:hypothetical protein